MTNVNGLTRLRLMLHEAVERPESRFTEERTGREAEREDSSVRSFQGLAQELGGCRNKWNGCLRTLVLDQTCSSLDAKKRILPR